MLCPVCGTYAGDEAIVCAKCGKLLERTTTDSGEEELMKFRQGRHLRDRQQKEAEQPEPPVRTGRSRAFEDPMPPETPESTGAVYTQREVLSSTGRYYGLESDEYAGASADGSAGRSGMWHELDEYDQAAEDQPPAAIQAREYQRRSRVKRSLNRRRAINWAYVIIAAFLLFIAAGVGTVVFLTRTESGQIIMARMGRDASAAAMWQVGEELYENYDRDKAIEYFLIAREKDEEAGTPNATGLLMLGEAYEAAGDLPAAAEVYEYVYTEVVPSAPEAYTNQVRVLQAMGRDAEAAVLLQTAYQMTGQGTFRTKRAEILPSVPTASVMAGYYTEKKNVALMQAQEYSIMYTLDPFAVLPDDGILYEGPIPLGEGEHELRAVAVYGDLVSDPMKVTYQIYMPTPLQPDANLAPGEYNSARKNVRLSPGKLSDEQKEKNPGYVATLDDPVAQDITIYYTIDGSIPDADSPIYTGEPIVMAVNGNMTLRAVSVNGYGKQGNMKEVGIKLVLRTKAPKVYNVEDVIGDLKVGSTTLDAFLKKHGQSSAQENLWLYGIDGECQRHIYPWGHATFMKTKSGWLLAEVYLTSNELSAPRGTAIGMTEEQITSKFKDFGQVTSPSGNRGLYHDIKNSDKGKIYVQEDGTKIIRYRTDTLDMHVWQLDYILDASGKVTAIHWLYER
ncbi:MAG: chitobiase/beta-hexosaminidase C-terminal domain-containing protein [Clostridia bacterium]|nr:chitobiase/beta-hexosaminidase C-terminal domain-containing protein [Clostridia bacterium]